MQKHYSMHYAAFNKPFCFFVWACILLLSTISCNVTITTVKQKVSHLKSSSGVIYPSAFSPDSEIYFERESPLIQALGNSKKPFKLQIASRSSVFTIHMFAREKDLYIDARGIDINSDSIMLNIIINRIGLASGITNYKLKVAKNDLSKFSVSRGRINRYTNNEDYRIMFIPNLSTKADLPSKAIPVNKAFIVNSFRQFTIDNNYNYQVLKGTIKNNSNTYDFIIINDPEETIKILESVSLLFFAPEWEDKCKSLANTQAQKIADARKRFEVICEYRLTYEDFNIFVLQKTVNCKIDCSK